MTKSEVISGMLSEYFPIVLASLQSGTYDNKQLVTLVSDVERIYYTLDGTIPSKESEIYSNPITIQGGDTTLHIVAENEYGDLGEVKVYTYSIQTDLIDQSSITNPIIEEQINEETPVSAATPTMPFSREDEIIPSSTPTPTLVPSSNITELNNKSLIRIEAIYSGKALTIGSMINKSDIVAKATFSDGTTETITDYIYSPLEINNEGKNEIKINYLNETSSFIITGVKPTTVNLNYISLYEGTETKFTIHDENEAKWFKITTTKADQTVKISVDSVEGGKFENSIYYTIYRGEDLSAGREDYIGDSWQSFNQASIASFKFDKAGDYYIKMVGGINEKKLTVKYIIT